MKAIQTNLLRDVCLRPRQRRWCYLLMLGHLFLWSGLLVESIFVATREICTVLELRDQTRTHLRSFSRHYGVAGDPKQEVAALRVQLDQLGEEAASIHGRVSKRLDLPRMAKYIQEPLPDVAFLLSIRLEARSKQFVFELVSPDIEGEPGLEPRTLIETWQKNVFLAEGIKRVEQIDTRHYEIGGGPVRVFTFSCALNNWDG